MSDQKRTPRPLRLSDEEAAPIAAVAAEETEGNFSMAVRKLIAEALRARALGSSRRGDRTMRGVATYREAGEVIVTPDGGSDDHVGFFDADGGEWDQPVRALLKNHGWSPVGDWLRGENAYDDVRINVVRLLDGRP